MALPMTVHYEIKKLSCGHEVPVYLWLEDASTRLYCRQCGRNIPFYVDPVAVRKPAASPQAA